MFWMDGMTESRFSQAHEHDVDASGYYALGSIWRCNAEEGWSNGYGLAQCLIHVQQFLSVFMASDASDASDALDALDACTDLEDELWEAYPSLAALPVPEASPSTACASACASVAAADVAAAGKDGGWTTVINGKHCKAKVPPTTPPCAAATSSSLLLDALYRALQPMGDFLDGADLAVVKHVCGERGESVVSPEAEFRCWYTGLSCVQDTICLPISYTRNPKTRKARFSSVRLLFNASPWISGRSSPSQSQVDYVLPLLDGYLSLTAFDAGVRVSPSGTAFTHVLPLYISAEHYGAPGGRADRLLTKLCRELRTTRIDLFCLLFSACAVQLADGGILALERCLQVLTLTLHLCDRVCSAGAGLPMPAEAHVGAFLRDPQLRTKGVTPSLGAFAALLCMVGRKERYTLMPYAGRISLVSALMEEFLTRCVLWVCKKRQDALALLLADRTDGASGDDAILASASFEGSKNAMRVLCIFRLLESIILADGGSHASFVRRLDGSHGLPTAVDVRRFRSGVLSARGMSSWTEALAALGLKGMDEAGIARQMRAAWARSLSLGYHARDTDFASIHRSGVSKLLLRGETYSGLGPGTDLLEVLDIWRWRKDHQGSRFLDATLFTVDADGNTLGYMDYANREMFADAGGAGGRPGRTGRPAATHSGDVMGYLSGKHSMQVWLSAFPPRVAALYIVVSAYDDAHLSDIVQPHVSVRDPGTGAELCKYVLEDQPTDERRAMKAVVLCSFTRKPEAPSAWNVNAIGKACMGSAGDYAGITECIKSLQLKK